ncbi:MAG: phosphatidylglycerophosphatase A [Candidatus Omnitrophica bacterium]|nr:phosphatidylglycerophosphatase A [Candidatus Omnitrophota bacterium]
MKIKIARQIATVFGLGYCPKAPGTIGSLAGLILCVLLHKYELIYLIIFIALFSAGVISSRKIEEETKEKDPSYIVIDEFACIFIAFLSIPITPLTLVIGFGLYRFIDISKIPPLKLLEKYGNGWGVMLDDLAAGIYVNLILRMLTV